MTFPASKNPSKRIFYGWWIVAAAFLNRFFEELGLVLDGVKAAEEGEGSIAQNSMGVTQAVRSHAFWLLLGGST
jgi:hypothetical protein